MKFRLSITVVFSAIAGYFLGIDVFDLIIFLKLLLGGFLVTGSANAFNQILERKHDKLMQRTAVRPLPKGNLSLVQALFFSLFIGILGIVLLNQINSQGSFFGLMSKSGFFGLLSILLYVLVYTPLKRISPFSITMGAIPGAIPFLLGFVAATDDFGLAAGTLFAIQFFWQFPHFIAIVWVQEKEYKKAGFKMMFGGKKGKYSAFIAIITSLLTLIVSIIPFFWKATDLTLSFFGMIVILLLGVWLMRQSIRLYIGCEDRSAKRLMYTSFKYLPLMQIVYVLDKFFIQ